MSVLEEIKRNIDATEEMYGPPDGFGGEYVKALRRAVERLADEVDALRAEVRGQ
jgi:hypothetical protein